MGRRKLLSKISQLGGHIIVCGYGRMGQTVISQLTQRGVTVVVIDNDPAKTTELEELGVLYILGDAAEEETLRQAGVMQARGLVAVLPEDSANVYVTLTARGLRDDLNIAARAEQLSAEPKLQRAGANRVICPSVIGAIRVANVMVRPNVADFIEVTAKGVELELDEYLVGPESPLKDQTLKGADLIRKAGVIVVAIKRADGETVFNPKAEEHIREGDTLIVIGPSGTGNRLETVGAPG
jgi:voltage-gated potassium channel